MIEVWWICWNYEWRYAAYQRDRTVCQHEQPSSSSGAPEPPNSAQSLHSRTGTRCGRLYHIQQQRFPEQESPLSSTSQDRTQWGNWDQWIHWSDQDWTESATCKDQHRGFWWSPIASSGKSERSRDRWVFPAAQNEVGNRIGKVCNLRIAVDGVGSEVRTTGG